MQDTVPMTHGGPVRAGPRSFTNSHSDRSMDERAQRLNSDNGNGSDVGEEDGFR